MWAVCVVAVAAAVLYVRWRRSGQSFFEFAALRMARLYTLFWHRWSSNGVAPLPAEGPALLYSNHTCSADPMFLIAGSPRALSFVVAREHYNISAPTHWILASLRCVPVTRDGKDAVGVR